MQPIPFVPFVWRDQSWFGQDDDATDLAHRPDTGLIGYEVEATDGSIGKVHDDNAEVPGDCLLVDTGPWIFGHKVVLPVGTVRRVDHDERKVWVDRTRQQIKDAPEYDADADPEDHRRRSGEYYSESYRLMPPML
ncbi:PRC-barrel domain containing protein [Lentzea sp. NPDC042327]|uniref:PRC-barrel domain containing protein n=1 Tax=Lentzea sp. NPDC042327 TaxID=3154801 RepID=UPI0033C4D015